MASSSTLPSSGKAMVFLSRVHVFWEKYWFVEENLSLLFYAWIPLCPAGVGGTLVDRHLQELGQVRDG